MFIGISISLGTGCIGDTTPPASSSLLLETGDMLLLETGDEMLLE